MPKVSDEYKSEIRQRLVVAASRVMAEHGPSGMTTRAIQEEAGVSAGTIYNYFPSMSQLFEAVGEHLWAAEWAGIVANLDSADTDGGFRAALEATVFAPVDEPDLQLAAVNLRTKLPASDNERDSIRNYNRFVVDTIAPTLIDGQREGHLNDSIDAEAAIELLDILRAGLTVRAAQDSWATSHERVCNTARRILDEAAFA